MKSPRTDIHHLANRTKKNLSQTARKSRASGRRRTTGLTRICALIVFAALAATALSVPSFHSLSSRSLSNAASAAAAPESWKETLAAANHAGLGGNSFSAERTGESAFWSHAAAIFPLAPVQAADPTVSFYESDCTTPRSVFSPGAEVCARIDGLNTSLFRTHFAWSNPDHEIKARSTEITSDGQTRKFTLAPDAALGGWQANITDQTGTIRAIGGFIVSDAANPAVDLSVNMTGPEKVVAGNDITYTIVVFNYGPDAAQNVVLTDDIPANTTFVSSGQNTGPVFNCTNNTATTTCTLASMPANTFSILTFTYNVVSATPTDTVITNRAEITNDHNDRNLGDQLDLGDSLQHFTDQVASAETRTAAAACALTCPENIIQQADVGQAGAIVTFASPSSTGECGTEPISCSQDSGTFFPVGTTPVTCVGQTGNACTFTVTIENPGGLSISLNGPNTLSLECGAVIVSDDQPQGFLDPGATAVNASGQNVPVTTSGAIDLSTTGAYEIVYTATEGENSVSVTRTVNVVDTTAPIITVDGANPYKIQQGSCLPFVDPGATATDGCAGPKPVTRTISGPGGLTVVDNNVPGTYTITYAASDGTRPATATRTVLVGNFPQDELDQPTTAGPPTITLNGDNQVTVECGSNFNDPGATASACGSSLPVTTSGSVDTHTPGIYTITYSATNEGGTAETHRTVMVEDTQGPVITLNGDNPMQVECHTAFADPGASATDACSGSVPITVSGTVDPNTPGTYTLTYKATDGTHPPTEVTRTVNVVDTQGPVITINGANPATVECHTSYTDAGATAFDACLNASVPVTTSGSVNVNATGTYTITYTATDGGRTSTATRTVNVVDTTPPVITLKTTQIKLWPPTHQYQTINAVDLVQSVVDSCGGNLSISSVYIMKATSDEPENGEGDGDTLNDMVISSDCKSVQLRAERAGGGDGRVYSLTVAVKDAAGNVGTAVFKVTVPKSQGNGGAAVDSGPNHTVNGNCP
ncbi:MAG TPA: immunoglobulin-like domain-containing protein [Pyrinomonadaceae bacterium]|jgi:uncharacterized repeat protein (TIGR01451 family)